MLRARPAAAFEEAKIGYRRLILGVSKNFAMFDSCCRADSPRTHERGCEIKTLTLMHIVRRKGFWRVV